MIVIVTGFIPLSPLSVVLTMVTWESSWLKELQENMDRCNECHDITEILFENSIKHHTTDQSSSLQ